MERLLLDLVHGICSPDSATRERSADEVTDVHRSMSPGDIDVLAHALVAARLVESVPRSQEAQLHALSDLAEWHELPRAPLERLRELAPPNDPSQVEYLSFLLP